MIKFDYMKNIIGMANEYESITGHKLNINSGFRTYDEQKALYTANPLKAVNPDAYDENGQRRVSRHMTGFAIDLKDPNGGSEQMFQTLQKMTSILYLG